MMRLVSQLKERGSQNVFNCIGWRSKRRIVVFESDDWGSIRMPSKKAFNQLAASGFPVQKSSYCKYDRLEAEEDLEALFSTLVDFKDKNGASPVFTANTVMANPDFERIRASNFELYAFEPFTETFKKYPGSDKVISLIHEGVRQRLFYPQFHGREHVNVPYWLRLLREGDRRFLKAFELGLWGLGTDIFPDMERNIQATYDHGCAPFQAESVIQGLEIFESTFGFRSLSFIANNYIWDSALHPVLASAGIECIQGMRYQLFPKTAEGRRKRVPRYVGQSNRFGQIFLVRNCEFEPSTYPKVDQVRKCLREIENAFFWGKPAIISTHRLNFVGGIELSNRSNNLRLLRCLLKEILRRWPDVEFLTSDELGKIVKRG